MARWRLVPGQASGRRARPSEKRTTTARLRRLCSALLCGPSHTRAACAVHVWLALLSPVGGLRCFRSRSAPARCAQVFHTPSCRHASRIGRSPEEPCRVAAVQSVAVSTVGSPFCWRHSLVELAIRARHNKVILIWRQSPRRAYEWRGMKGLYGRSVQQIRTETKVYTTRQTKLGKKNKAIANDSSPARAQRSPHPPTCNGPALPPRPPRTHLHAPQQTVASAQPARSLAQPENKNDGLSQLSYDPSRLGSAVVLSALPQENKMHDYQGCGSAREPGEYMRTFVRGELTGAGGGTPCP